MTGLKLLARVADVRTAAPSLIDSLAEGRHLEAFTKPHIHHEA